MLMTSSVTERSSVLKGNNYGGYIKMSKAVKLYLVMPCYNEEEILEMSSVKAQKLYDRLMETQVITSDSRIVFVDDGSRDRTWEIINSLHEKNHIFRGIRLSRNKGHQIAIYSGMVYSAEQGADCVITIDADLQQDIEAIFYHNYIMEGGMVRYAKMVHCGRSEILLRVCGGDGSASGSADDQSCGCGCLTYRKDDLPGSVSFFESLRHDCLR